MSDSYQLKIDVSAIDKMIKKFEAASKAVDKLQAKIDKLNNTPINPTPPSVPPGPGPSPSSTPSSTPSGGNPNNPNNPNHPNNPNNPNNPNHPSNPNNPNHPNNPNNPNSPNNPSNPRSPGFPRLPTSYPGMPGVLSGALRFIASMGTGAAIGAGVAAAGIGLGIEGVRTGAERIDIKNATGGTFAQAAQMQAMGIGGAEVNAFGERLRAGGAVSAFFRSKGLRDIGELETNRTNNYFKAIEILRDVKDERTRSVILRNTPEIASQSAYINAPEKLYQQWKKSQERAITPSPEIQKAQIEMDIAKQNISDVLTEAGGGAAATYNYLASRPLIGELALGGAMIGALGSPLGSAIGAAIGAGVGAIGYGIYDAFHPDTPESKTRKEADKKGNEITDMFNDPLNQRIFRDEIVGGGQRTRASANLGMIAANINNFGVQESIRLGAFPVY